MTKQREVASSLVNTYKSKIHWTWTMDLELIHIRFSSVSVNILKQTTLSEFLTTLGWSDHIIWSTYYKVASKAQLRLWNIISILKCDTRKYFNTKKIKVLIITITHPYLRIAVSPLDVVLNVDTEFDWAPLLGKKSCRWRWI